MTIANEHGARVWWLLAACVAMACNTGAASGGGTDSSSHWLGSCDTGADCAGELDCYCGLCTRTCEQAANCSDLDANAVCSATHASCEQGAASICTRAEEPNAAASADATDFEPSDAGELVGDTEPALDPSTTSQSSSTAADPTTDVSVRPAGDAGSSPVDEPVPPAVDAAAPSPVGDTTSPLASTSENGAPSEAGAGGASGCHDSTECAASELCRGPYEACDAEPCGPTGECQSDADCRAQAPGEDLTCRSDGQCATKSCDVEACSANFTCTPVSTTSADPQTFYYCTTTTCTADGDCAAGSVCVARSGGNSRYCADVLGECVAEVQPPSECEVDSCRPEVCDEVGERCCDPSPGDGPNYCNLNLSCTDGACAAPTSTTAESPCGDGACAEGFVCCDPCQDSCVSALSGAACPNADIPKAECSLEQRVFSCGQTTQCSFVATQYCEVFVAGPLPEANYRCVDLPAACLDALSCDCLDGDAAFDGTECSVGANGELIVTLPPAP